MSRTKSSAAILLGLAMGACASGAPSDLDVRPNAPALTFEEFVANAVRDESRDVWIVDGDTPVRTLEELREVYEHIGRTRVAYGTSDANPNALSLAQAGGGDDVWDGSSVLNLTFCVDQSFGSNHGAVVSAMQQAGADWSGVANVRFIYHSEHDANCQPGNSGVVFDVRPVDSGGEFLAAAFFPSWPRSQRTLQVDGAAFRPTGTAVTLTGVLRHELGHVLGFRHEHTRPEAGTCFEDNDYRTLTPYDRDSVMHYPQCNGNSATTLSITALDAQGAASVYGSSGATGPSPTPTPSDPTPSDPTPSDPGPTEPPPGDPTPLPGEPPPPPPSGAHCVSAAASIAEGESHIYPPVGLGSDVTVTLSGTGDVDLYAWAFGTLSVCISEGPTASESCTLSGGGPVLVEVYGYTAGSYQLQVCAR
ncbi:MAG: matrixin family metalloprotease [Sandaracinaceae bacterium]